MTTVAHKTEKLLEKIRKEDGKVGAFIEVYDDAVIKQAEDVDRKIAAGKAGPLAGTVIALKNNMAVKGKRLTCASKMLENYTAPYGATVTRKLLDADAVIIGSANLDEFACGSDTTKSALKKTSNPRDLERVPGGSSGGSAAAVAAGFCDAALGSDTGGSIRCPASFCGVVGYKPTYGTVSRYGLVDMGMSLDQIGPLANDVETAARVLETIVGEDPRDLTTKGSKSEKYSSLAMPSKLRAAVPKEFFDGCDPTVADVVWRGIKKLEAQGVEVKEISFPMLKYSIPIYFITVFSEFASAMQKYDGLKYGIPWTDGNLMEAVSEARDKGFGMEVKRRILLGTYVTTKEFRDAWYSRTLKARDALKKEFARVFKDADIVLGPTMPVVAWKRGERGGDPVQMYLADVLTAPANCAGIPAGSVPCGEAHGLPVGLQVMGGAGSDALVLKVMKAAQC